MIKIAHFTGLRAAFIRDDGSRVQGVYLGNLRDERGDIQHVIALDDARDKPINLMTVHPSRTEWD